MKNIKRLRAKENMTQQVLANKLGISRTQLNTWENYSKSLSAENEQKLIDIFNCSIFEIYGMDEFKHYPKDTETKIGIINMLYGCLEKEDKEKVISMLQEAIDNE